MTEHELHALMEHGKSDLARLILRLEKERDEREALWREYHEWLGEANKGPIILAAVHHWRCPDEDVARGKDYRKRLGLDEGASRSPSPTR